METRADNGFFVDVWKLQTWDCNQSTDRTAWKKATVLIQRTCTLRQLQYARNCVRVTCL